MSPPYPISVPAGFAPAFALGYAGQSGDLALVAPTAPLPVQIMNDVPTGPGAAPLTGSATGALLAGPFTPRSTAPVILALWGEWTGTVQLERAAGPDEPRLPVTAGGAAWARFTANACEAVWAESEAGAGLYLAIAVTAGTLHYRIAQ